MANTTGKKYGGRAKGTLNKSTVEVRTMLWSFVENRLEQMGEAFDEMAPRDKVYSIIKILPFLLPRMYYDTYPVEEPKQDLSKLSFEELKELTRLVDKITINQD